MEVLGFRVVFSRPEDRFAYLDLDGAHLMLEELGGFARIFTTAPLVRPYGRGINFQIEVPDVDVLYACVLTSGLPVPVPLEERWCRENDIEKGVRLFAVADPDGYLLRFLTDLGQRPVLA